MESENSKEVLPRALEVRLSFVLSSAASDPFHVVCIDCVDLLNYYNIVIEIASLLFF